MSPQRYRCTREQSSLIGTNVQIQYVNLSPIDLGEFWLWQSDKTCGTILLNAEPVRHNTAKAMLFPKRLNIGGGWRGATTVRFAGDESHSPNGALNVRYHVIPQSAGNLVELRLDVKYDLRNSRSGNLDVVGEHALVTYKPNGTLVSMKATVDGVKYSLIDCRDSAAHCEAPQ
ncbi:MAG: hypothetical protein QM803_18900 [Rhodocyclaceae bacterium]